MPAKPTAAAVLAEKMLQAMGRIKGTPAYPPTLRELADAVDPDLDPALILKAAATKKLFGQAVVILQPKNLDSPLAATGDEAALLQSPRTLIFLMELLCSPNKPLVEPSKLRAKVPAPLRGTWDELLQARFQTNDFPPEITPLRVGRKNYLHLNRHPLPRPPEEQLAQDMLAYLKAQRQAGEPEYPLPLVGLQRAAAPQATAALVKKALGLPLFQEQVLWGMKASPIAPLVLRADRERLVNSEALFLAALRQVRSSTNQVVALAELKKKIAGELQTDFAAAVHARREEDRLPAGVGSLILKKTPVFFFLEDLVRGIPLVPAKEKKPDQDAAPREEPGDAALERAFEELDRHRGGSNFVSLVDLRRAVPLNRPAFDQALNRLRRAGTFSLSAAEGRHGLGPEEIEAAIREEGALLLYVSKKNG